MDLCWSCGVLLLVGAFILYKILDRLIRLPFLEGLGDRYIFITGCDTGFGHETAKKLDRMGCNVFAGCLTESGENELRKHSSSRLKTVPLDVSKQDSITKAYEYIKKTLPPGKGLWGVVNNAGIGGRFVGPIEWLRQEDYDHMMSINLYGVINTSITMLPLVKIANGRFVNTASVFGRFSLLGNTPYSISKFGVEAFSDGLRREMKDFNVSVHLIEPGFHKTNISDSGALSRALQAAWDRLPQRLKDDYGEEFLQLNIDNVINERIANMCSERIHDVVDAYIHALLGCYPRARYVIGKDANFVWLPLQSMPEWMGDGLLRLPKNRPRPACVIKNR